MQYRVRNLKDDTYQVWLEDFVYNAYHEGHYEEMVFQGSIADCEAWIRLKEKGYM